MVRTIARSPICSGPCWTVWCLQKRGTGAQTSSIWSKSQLPVYQEIWVEEKKKKLENKRPIRTYIYDAAPKNSRGTLFSDSQTRETFLKAFLCEHTKVPLRSVTWAFVMPLIFSFTLYVRWNLWPSRCIQGKLLFAGKVAKYLIWTTAQHFSVSTLLRK